MAGNAVGTALDDIETRNRAEIAAQFGRPVTRGAATTTEVLDMTRAGVAPRLIINYVNSAGMVQSISAQDVIYLHEQGVNTDMIQVMQNPCSADSPTVVSVPPLRQTVIIEEDPWGPYYYPRYGFWYGSDCRCH